jgi:hypothetical protein
MARRVNWEAELSEEVIVKWGKVILAKSWYWLIWVVFRFKIRLSQA